MIGKRDSRPHDIRALFAIGVVCLIASDASAQMQIDEIAITSGPTHYGGVFIDFFVDPVVFGSGIASVKLSSQNGVLDEVEMFEVTPGEFICDQGIASEPCEEFVSLAAVSALGALTFDFVGDMGETDSETVVITEWDPGSGQSGFPNVTFPSEGQTGVSPSATFTWTSPPSWVQALSVGIDDVFTGVTPDEDLFFGAPVTTTSWTPSGMSSGNAYDFEISYFDPILFEAPRTTNGADAYFLTSAFESYNSVVFAVPEPSGPLAFAAGSLLIASLAHRGRSR